MEKYAWKAKIKSGCDKEYRKRHDAICLTLFISSIEKELLQYGDCRLPWYRKK